MAMAMSACGGDESAPGPGGPSGPEFPAGMDVFAYGISPGQTISAAPFPNDLYRGDAGVELAPLGDDPLFAAAGTAATLAMLDGRIAGRAGFGFAAPIELFTSEAVELESFAGKVELVALDGPEATRRVILTRYVGSDGKRVSFFPAAGEYLMPDTSYGFAVEAGVTTLKGAAIGSPAGFIQAMSASPPQLDAGGWERLLPLRQWLGTREKMPVVAVVFKTEPSLAPLVAMQATVTSAVVQDPTRALRFDVRTSTMIDGEAHEGVAALDAFFGVAKAPFEHNPGSWDSGSRVRAAVISGETYTGGSFRGKVAKVVHGSVRVPAFNAVADGGKAKNAPLDIEDGIAKVSLDAMVPITLFLCEEHLGGKSAKLPLIVFTHGGTATRNNGTPIAAMGCELGIATLSYDMPFHGGRSETALAAGGVVVPTRNDDFNQLTGIARGEAGFVPDGVGDAAGADKTVGPLFGINDGLDPAYIEANMLAIPAELLAVARIAKEGDWSAFHAGLSFDAERVFHVSLSFGSSFTTGAHAVSDAFRSAVGSTAAGNILGASLTVAPSNAELSGTIVQAILGLTTSAEELQRGAYRDPVVGLVMWLAERGDAMAFTPYVLRHRDDTKGFDILHSGNSWDPTLASSAQLQYNRAIGFEALTSPGFEPDATMPGADTILAEPVADEGVSGNVTYGGIQSSAAIFYNSESCHSELITPLCTKVWASSYPPVTALADTDVTVKLSPICALHAQALAFLGSTLKGQPRATIIAPAGDCASVYGP